MLQHIMRNRWLLAAMLLLCAMQVRAQGVVVVGHSAMKKLDAVTVGRVFTGRIADVDGTFVTAINHPAGSEVRNKFLQACLRSSEVKYRSHWTVYKNSGLGPGLKEVGRSSDVLRFVAATPGAIGYVLESELEPGGNVLLRCGESSVQSTVEQFVDRIVSQVERLFR